MLFPNWRQEVTSLDPMEIHPSAMRAMAPARMRASQKRRDSSVLPGTLISTPRPIQCPEPTSFTCKDYRPAPILRDWFLRFKSLLSQAFSQKVNQSLTPSVGIDDLFFSVEWREPV